LAVTQSIGAAGRRALTLRLTVEALREADIPHALIGGWAARAHGGTRLTRDIDLLASDVRVLDPAIWAEVERAGIKVSVRLGDEDDPLVGGVRVGTRRATLPVDVVLPRGRWAREMLTRAVDAGAQVLLAGVPLTVVQPPDLALLKLSHNPKDREDLAGLLARDDAPALIEQVEASVTALPEFQREIWARLRARLRT